MPLVSMRQVLDEASKGGYGVGAFNVNNMEQIQAIIEATELNPEIPVVLHQDHGNSPATCKSAIEMGFTSVMMDGSLMEDGKTPSTFEYNVQVTREVVAMAHARGITVEG